MQRGPHRRNYKQRSQHGWDQTIPVESFLISMGRTLPTRILPNQKRGHRSERVRDENGIQQEGLTGGACNAQAPGVHGARAVRDRLEYGHQAAGRILLGHDLCRPGVCLELVLGAPIRVAGREATHRDALRPERYGWAAQGAAGGDTELTNRGAPMRFSIEPDWQATRLSIPTSFRPCVNSDGGLAECGQRRAEGPRLGWITIGSIPISIRQSYYPSWQGQSPWAFASLGALDNTTRGFG